MYNDYNSNDFNMTNRKKKKNQIILAILICVALVIAIVVAIFFLGNRQVEVPELYGMTLDEANSVASEYDLTVNKSKDVASDTLERGCIASQNPVPGEKIDKKSIITVAISMGKGTSYVPNVVGMTAGNAEIALTEAGYKGAIREVDGPRPAGVVIEQDKKKNSEVEKGKIVGYAVSRGNMTYVPSICGKYIDDAVDKLYDAGLEVEYDEVESGKDEGTVLSQSKTGLVYFGTTVYLTISMWDDDDYWY